MTQTTDNRCILTRCSKCGPYQHFCPVYSEYMNEIDTTYEEDIS